MVRLCNRVGHRSHHLGACTTLNRFALLLLIAPFSTFLTGSLLRQGPPGAGCVPRGVLEAVLFNIFVPRCASLGEIVTTQHGHIPQLMTDTLSARLLRCATTSPAVAQLTGAVVYRSSKSFAARRRSREPPLPDFLRTFST